MKVLVCGGRNYNDFFMLNDTLDALHRKDRITEVIHGAARGADSLAGERAVACGIKETRVAANWTDDGLSAGSIRNKKMLGMEPDLVVAFPGGTGTAHMVRIAKVAGVKVMEIAEL